MDIINHYEVIIYKHTDRDKYTNKSIWADCKIYYMNGKRHRDNDLPAIIYSNNRQEWYINGKLHRENDQPAVIDSNGFRRWYINGKLHRDNDQPAVIYYDRSPQEWWVNGKRIG